MRAPRSGILRTLVALAAAVLVIAVAPLPAAAECDGPPPSFREALPTAKRVVIGDVIDVQVGGLAEARDANGRSSRFTIRVLFAPVGDAPSIMVIRDLTSQPCAGVVVARIGDRIALAIDAVAFTPPIPVNAVAWIQGSPPDDVESITTLEVFRLLGLPPPASSIATAQPTVADQPTQPGLPVVSLVALAAAALALIALALAGSSLWRHRRSTR